MTIDNAGRPALISLISLHTILTVEFINRTTGLYSLLLACVERMAFGTDFYMDFLFCRTSYKLIATVAYHLCLIIGRMNSFSHYYNLHSAIP